MAYNTSNIRNAIRRSAKYTVTNGNYPQITVPAGVYTSVVFLNSTSMIEFEVMGDKILNVKSFRPTGGSLVKFRIYTNIYTDESVYTIGEIGGDVHIQYTYSTEGKFPTISSTSTQPSVDPAIYNYNEIHFLEDTISTKDAKVGTLEVANNLNQTDSNSSVTINGETVMNGPVTVTGSTNVSRNLSVTGDSTFNSNLEITGKTCAEDVEVYGLTYVKGSIKAASIETEALIMTQTVAAADLQADSVLINKLNVSSGATFKGNTTINGNIKVSNTTNGTNLKSKDLNISGSIKSGSITAGSIGNTSNKPTVSANTMKVSEINADSSIEAGTISANTVNGRSKISADTINAKEISQYSTEKLTITADTINGASSISSSTISASSITADTITSSGDITSNEGITTKNLTVTGNGTINGASSVDGKLTVGNGLSVTNAATIVGDVELKSGDLSIVSGDIIFKKTEGDTNTYNIEDVNNIKVSGNISANGNITAVGNLTAGRVDANYVDTGSFKANSLTVGEDGATINGDVTAASVSANNITASSALKVSEVKCASITTDTVKVGNWILTKTASGITITFN